jgi:hypothetical protein
MSAQRQVSGTMSPVLENWPKYLKDLHARIAHRFRRPEVRERVRRYAWVWRHATRSPHLMDARLMDARQRKCSALLVVALPLVFALSIGVSFTSALAAELSWLLVFLVRPVLLRITHYSGADDR